MDLSELRVYNRSMEVGEIVWSIVNKWDYFAKDTVGKQLVRSIDSVAANLSEGFGRYHYKENKHFCYYSRGSLYESKTWITKAHSRNLIDQTTFDELNREMEDISVKLNNYISTIGKAK
jgi:four helix bundle protein